jgi:RNA polymerase sigma factor (sigma-70 family)
VQPDRRSGLGAEAFADVLAAARANAPWAFERLYHDLAPAVTGYLRLRGAREPEDLTNEVLLGVFQGLDRFEGDAAGFRSWVFTIAHRRVIDERRRRGARPETAGELPDHLAPPGGDVEQEALAGLADGEVARLLAELTEDQRDVLLLRVLADLSVAEVAHITGKEPGAVKMLQRRGLAALRRLLEREGVTS